LWFTFGSIAGTWIYVLYVVKFNYVVESLVGKKKTNYLFCFIMWDARWFVYPQIMDRSDNMGGKDLTCGNENYER
jgi:hypothetical protein